MVALSVLDLVPVPEGHTPADAFAHAKDLAQIPQAGALRITVRLAALSRGS